MERSNWERRAAILITVCLGMALLYLVLRYALPLFLPFLVAWGLALMVRPLSVRLAKRTGIPQKVLAVVLLLLLLGGVLFLAGLSVRRLVTELQNLLERLLSEGSGLSEFVQSEPDYFELLTSKISFLQRIGVGERFAAFREGFNTMAENLLNGALTSLTSGIPKFVTEVVSALPSALFVTVITVIAGFYFCMDSERIGQGLAGLLPSSIRVRLPQWKARAQTLSWRYVRAYLLLLLLTFAELFLGFCILGVDYAFLLAALIAVVDLLPVLGVGTVLVPWAAVMLLQHNYFLGFGLLILYFAMTVLRQIMEPKLVGKSLGLHPLLTVFSTYAGWQLFGFLGMLLGPFLAFLGKLVYEQYRR
ncbi:MAG: sporulation integral membrane protein YtvI [Clostridia bacterium]|nr:sporulation integral membrane protein YtvI [Clostridia bacterium]